jgi:Mg/Co/Ni transporter MgtE
VVQVAAAAVAEPLTADALGRLVLLKRDVMDALVLDLKNLRDVRANDLWLRADAGALVLAAADVSPWAVVHRLTRGRLPHEFPKELVDWRDVEFLRGDPRAAQAGHDYHRRVARLQPTIIARLTDGLPYLHAAELLTLLDDSLAADVLEHMLPERQAQVITELETAQAARLVAEMAPDLAADLLGQLDQADATTLLGAIPPPRAEAIETLLRFPADTAGGIMTSDVVVAPADATVGEVVDYIRPQLSRPDFIYFVYLLTDLDSRRLRGIATLRDLSLADAATPVDRLMQKDVVTIGPLERALEAAHRVSEYGLNALPVVTPDGSLVGIVTLDKAMAQIVPQIWRDHGLRIFA